MRVANKCSNLFRNIVYLIDGIGIVDLFFYPKIKPPSFKHPLPPNPAKLRDRDRQNITNTNLFRNQFSSNFH